MRKLLVVEDEKIIRQGICAIIKRLPVSIEEIIECANGKEALEIIEKGGVDVMIADIHMPVMDGIELINRLDDVKDKPQTIVISGYDEFEYAVSALKKGARDYLVKPVSREKLSAAVIKLDNELGEKRKLEKSSNAAKKTMVKMLMRGEFESEAEKESLIEQLRGDLGSYRMVCVGECGDLSGMGEITVNHIDGHNIIIMKGDFWNSAKTTGLAEKCPGVTAVFSGAESLNAAYLQAKEIRGRAFVRCEMMEHPINAIKYKYVDLSAERKQIVRFIGSGNGALAKQAVSQIVLLAQNNVISPALFADEMQTTVAEIMSNFKTKTGCDFESRNIWSFNNIYEYYTQACGWIDSLCAMLKDDSDSENRRRINKAAQYLEENYLSDVDMAMVSNFISMNYTQFSYLFKLYTGRNFLEYLKGLRVEEGKRLLGETDMRIKEISLKSGFKNEKHFMKVFKQFTGISPSEYRKFLNVSKNENNAKY